MKFFLLLFSVLISATAYLQTEAESIPPTPPELQYIPLTKGCGTEPDSNEQITDFADIEPSFQGGEDSLQNFIRKNLIYPKEAPCGQWVVYVQFVVREDGSLTDAVVLKGATPLLDKEALPLISVMPKWTPGSLDGKIVAVRYIIPIRFYIQ